MPLFAAAVLLAVFANPAGAQTQTPAVSLRPFLLVAGERFTASETFTAIFGGPVQPVWGGGLNVAFRRGLFIDVTASRFAQTGDRAFFFEGESFPLGLPLTVKITPLEISAGARLPVSPTVAPYLGAGFGTYKYEESSEFDGEPFEARHSGYLLVGGVEFRVSRFVAISTDVHYTRVPGIIGGGGLSAEAGEDDLGGLAGRFRLIIGR